MTDVEKEIKNLTAEINKKEEEISALRKEITRNELLLLTPNPTVLKDRCLCFDEDGIKIYMYCEKADYIYDVDTRRPTPTLNFHGWGVIAKENEIRYNIVQYAQYGAFYKCNVPTEITKDEFMKQIEKCQKKLEEKLTQINK